MSAEYSRLEAALRALYHAEAPDPRFLNTLEGRLLRPPAPPRRRVRLAWAFALLLLAFVLWFGPERVVAQVQRWLGYVPQVGFVDLEAARILPHPLSVTRDGVTLVVSQVVADAQRTTLVLHVEGLPPESQTTRNHGAMDPLAEASLVLADGTRLPVRKADLRYGEGTYIFDPLPPDQDQMVFEIRRLPLVAEGIAPQDWQVLLSLQPATGAPSAGVVHTQAVDAADTHHGITLRVLDMAADGQRTAVRWQLTWPDHSWGFFGLHSSDIVLRDDLNQVYRQYSEQTASAVAVEVQQITAGGDPFSGATEGELIFQPLSQAASSVSLVVPDISFHIPLDLAVPIDLGDHPQVGDAWVLDRTVDVAGVPVRLLRAMLTTTTIWQSEQQRSKATMLAIEAVAPVDGERILRDLNISSPEIAAEGTAGSNDVQGHFVWGIVLNARAPLPQGVVHVRLTQAQVALRGPWTVTWSLPTPTQSGTHWQPQGQSVPHDGLSVRLREVLHTDRLTGVRFEAESLPSDAEAFLGALPVGFDLFGSRASLEDDRGHRETVQWETTWLDTGSLAYPTPTLSFPPTDPLASRWTVRVPGMAVQFSGEVTFEVTVPPDAPVHDPDRFNMRGDWSPNVAADIAGFHLQVTSAFLSDRGLPQLSLKGRVQSTRADSARLLGFRLLEVEGPDGIRQSRDISLLPTGANRLRLDIPIGPPGTYRITLHDPIGYFPGPWVYHWGNQP